MALGDFCNRMHSTGDICAAVFSVCFFRTDYFPDLYKRHVLNVKDGGFRFPPSLPRICLDKSIPVCMRFSQKLPFQFNQFHSATQWFGRFVQVEARVGLVGKSLLMVEYIFFFSFFLADLSDCIAVRNWLWTI